MKRRSLLAGIGVTTAALAGCMGGGGCWEGDRVIFEPVDTEAIASREMTSEGELLDHTPGMMAGLAIQTLDGNEPEIETLSRSPLSWLTYVKWNGQVYDFHEEKIAEGSVSGPEYELSHDRGTSDDISVNDALSFTDLPLHDQWRINGTADFAVDSSGGMPGFSTTFVAGYLGPGDQDESVLAAGVDYPGIEVNGNVAELMRVGEGRATARQFRYTANVVAEDADAFVNQILEQRGAELPSLSDDAMMLLQEARENDGRVVVCDEDIDEETGALTGERWRNARDELKETLVSLERESESSDIRYVRHEGEWYRFDISAL